MQIHLVWHLRLQTQLQILLRYYHLGGNGHASDTFASVVASALLNDMSTPASAVGISAEINQVSDTNAQISIIKEADKKEIVIDRVTYSDSATAEAYVLNQSVESKCFK